MCGIATILLAPQERPAWMWQEIKDCLAENLVYNEERGKDATGLAVIQADGRMRLAKLPLAATDFVKTPDYDSLLATVGPQTTLLLGHTRRPTKGDPSAAANNHPILAGPICGIHNGEINNDDDLFAICGCPRRGQVDSEVIFRLLEPLSPLRLNGDYLTTVRSQLRRLEGSFTFLACDRRVPDRLLVVRHQRSLSVHFHPGWNALIFSSRYIFLRKRFGQAVLAETLTPDHLMLFEARAIPHLKHQPAVAITLSIE